MMCPYISPSHMPSALHKLASVKSHASVSAMTSGRSSASRELISERMVSSCVDVKDGAWSVAVSRKDSVEVEKGDVMVDRANIERRL